MGKLLFTRIQIRNDGRFMTNILVFLLLWMWVISDGSKRLLLIPFLILLYIEQIDHLEVFGVLKLDLTGLPLIWSSLVLKALSWQAERGGLLISCANGNANVQPLNTCMALAVVHISTSNIHLLLLNVKAIHLTPQLLCCGCWKLWFPELLLWWSINMDKMPTGISQYPIFLVLHFCSQYAQSLAYHIQW